MNPGHYDADNYTDENFDALVNNVAEACHEANRAYCESLGDNSQLSWENAPEWQKSSTLMGVLFHMKNPNADASASHQNWLEGKQAEGWSYGPVKDVENKRHPCFVPFNELPIEQQIKCHIFRSVVHGTIACYAESYMGT